jgi:hypothetical protein
MADRPATQRKAKHPGKKCLRDEGILYGETKKPIKLSLTPTAIGYLEAEAARQGISKSEVVEQFARNQLSKLPTD